MIKKKLGLIINPRAGMGGSVGLKGTDGKQLYEKALELGAEPVTPGRTQELLDHIKHLDKIHFLAAPGRMGESYLEGQAVSYERVGEIPGETAPEDTRRIARRMVQQGAECLIFIGGDGTARDVYDAMGTEVPVVAVPSGVKMYSSVFANNPRDAARLVDAFLEGTETNEEEVLDIDEEAYRQDRLSSRLYGYLKVPAAQRFIQPGKAASSVNPSARQVKKEIAAYLVEEMDPGRLYLLGPGTTVSAIAEELGLPKTLLGVDAVADRKLVGEDVNERKIFALFERYQERSIIVTPIGGNGFIFGRGSKQFTPEVIRGVGRENILVAASGDKIRSLDSLRVDTGDPRLDETLSGYLRVVIGYKRRRVVKVRG